MTPTEYVNVGEYEGRQGCHHPTTYPSARGIPSYPRVSAYPGTMPVYLETPPSLPGHQPFGLTGSAKGDHYSPENHYLIPSSSSIHINLMNDEELYEHIKNIELEL